jgi:hypothetical protein
MDANVFVQSTTRSKHLRAVETWPFELPVRLLEVTIQVGKSAKTQRRISVKVTFNVRANESTNL